MLSSRDKFGISNCGQSNSSDSQLLCCTIGCEATCLIEPSGRGIRFKDPQYDLRLPTRKQLRLCPTSEHRSDAFAPNRRSQVNSPYFARPSLRFVIIAAITQRTPADDLISSLDNCGLFSLSRDGIAVMARNSLQRHCRQNSRGNNVAVRRSPASNVDIGNRYCIVWGSPSNLNVGQHDATFPYDPAFRITG